MSGIFGTYNRNGQPVEHRLWERLGSLAAHRGPDGTFIKAAGNVLLGFHALRTTTESLQEQLPYICCESGLWITADARIDNRIELLHLLAGELRRAESLSDSQIILAAYQKWGVDSFHRLLGDFAFVIWDSYERQMICVRDYIGVRPLHYTLSAKLFAFSSEIKQLVMHPEIADTPNEGMVGEYLAATFVSKTETLFQDILRVAPGHYLTVGPNQTRIQQYWAPTFKPRLRYAAENDYVEHFQEIFSEAVRCRLRSHLPVSIELSGGLDSSSIVGMAHALSAGERSNGFSIYSLVYPGYCCDERQYIESVQEHLGLPVHYIDASSAGNPDWDYQVLQTYNPPDAPNLSNSDILLKKVQRNNSRVLLTGIGGDEWFTGSDHVFPELLSERDFSGFVRELRYRLLYDRKRSLRNLAIGMLWPFLPQSVRAKIIRWRREYLLIPPWINPTFANKIHLVERLLKGFAEPYVNNLACVDFFNIFLSGNESMVLEVNNNHKNRFQVEVRHPFLDRRLAEFALALPNSLHIRNGQRKYLLRLAGKGILPPLVQNRRTKAEFSQLYYRALSVKAVVSVLQNTHLSTRHWIDKQPLLDVYKCNQDCFQKNPAGPCPGTNTIWFAFAISKWYSVL